MDTSQNVIWIDCEFTGLNYQKDTILEIAVVVTDKELNILKEPLSLAVHHDQEVLDASNDFVKKTIPEVLERSAESKNSIEEVEKLCLEYLEDVTQPGVSQLAGNTIGSDRHMLYYKMPELEKWCHYRNIDVSSFKECAERWKPELLLQFTKKETHRALDDILESIEEMRVYKKLFLNL